MDQAKGGYPPPPGASPVLGLEVAGEVAAVGPSCSGFSVGDRVMSLVTGGGYAQYCVAPAATSFLIPSRLTFTEAAAVPESYFTLWSNVFVIGELAAGETFLVHGGASGVGSSAIQLARRHGAIVVTTARTQEQVEACRRLGADFAIAYPERDFEEAVRAWTGGRGVDVILDLVGADYLERHLRLLRRGGRLLLIDSRSGDWGRIDLGAIIERNLVLTGSVLRSSPLGEKRELARGIAAHLLPWLESGEIRPLLSRALPLGEAAEAHRILEASSHIGKVVLEVC